MYKVKCIDVQWAIQIAGVLAQSVERPPHYREVVGSNHGRVIPKDVKTQVHSNKKKNF